MYYSLSKKEKIVLITSCILFCCMIVSSIGFFMYADRIRIFSKENRILLETSIVPGYEVIIGECSLPADINDIDCDKLNIIFEIHVQPNSPTPGTCRKESQACSYGSKTITRVKTKTRILKNDYFSSQSFETLSEAKDFINSYPENETVYINPDGILSNDISMKQSELASGLLTLCFLIFFISSLTVFFTMFIIRKRKNITI